MCTWIALFAWIKMEFVPVFPVKQVVIVHIAPGIFEMSSVQYILMQLNEW